MRPSSDGCYPIEGNTLAASESVNWLFGRGLSCACKLSWEVLPEWRNIPREEKIERIKVTLRKEMDSRTIDGSVIQRLLRILEQHTSPNWRNRFITTNWDYLLQREIKALDINVLPNWLASSHVSHLNGTVEDIEDNSHRSLFLLEEDPAAQRCFTPEANIAYDHLIQGQTFVVVGMSFECDTDKFLLSALTRVEDDKPIGDSTWVVVNRNPRALELSCSRIARALPRASVKCVCADFNGWLESGLPELQECGAIVF